MLQHVTKGYNGFRTLGTNYKVFKFVKLFFKKSGQVVITCYNVSQNVTKAAMNLGLW